LGIAEQGSLAYMILHLLVSWKRWVLLQLHSMVEWEAKRLMEPT